MSRLHVVIVNRWRERYADYARYLDHSAHRVSYVSTEVGLGSVPSEAAEVALVDATDDLSQVRAALDGLVRSGGPPDRVVALKEDDLLVGAQLREDWGLPGPRRAELLPFRDKLLMCRRIAQAGLPVPAFAEVTGPDSVLELARTAGWPLVLKPRVGSSSAGVVLLTGPEDVDRELPGDEPMLVQAFNPHPIHHVDGVFTGRGPACLRISRYVNSCLGFRTGSFLGSVEEDDPLLSAEVETAVAAFLGALTSEPVPFHLEVFVQRSPGRVRCTFLEAGARVGGAEIPFIWRELHGYDLMRAAFDLQLGLPVPEPPRAEAEEAGEEVGGWLLVPAPTVRPCLITEATSMLGRRPGPYAETLPSPGAVVPAADAYYEHVGGRFRFRGRSSAEVETALLTTAAGFRVSAEPLGTVGPRIPERTR